ncbi:MAG TPA: serine/threonine-protein kinase [Candidatus Binataceae bacterium]|jgi:serine/threonine-protein kinase|nr:serine/threonine-protein kinase [Candidatus Binataceae bacterium]
MRELTVGERLDQYRLTEVLARSGMASIFKAIDETDGRPVVLKIPYAQYEKDPVFYSRFQREEKIGQRLDHPNLIKILTPRRKSRVYIAMEFVDGESLRAKMRGGAALPLGVALNYARQICEALTYIHGQGVVHRDLKPENILINERGQIKIMDFGIALDKWAQRLTFTGKSSGLGTPDYMAPEQVSGQRGDARSDLYALGTILFEMLTGSVPFAGLDVFSTMRAKADSDPQLPSAFKTDLDPHLEEIVLHAIERRPQLRYASAEAMLQDLREPAKVKLEGRAKRLKPIDLRKERLKRVLLVACCFGALIAAFVGLIFLSKR